MGFLQWIGLIAVMGITALLTSAGGLPLVVIAIAIIATTATYIAWIGKRNGV